MSDGHLRETLERTLLHLEDHRYDTRDLIFERPATESELRSAESDLGIELPPSYRNVLRSVSRKVVFQWFAPKELEYPEPFQSSFSGDIHWSLPFTIQFNKEKNSWIAEVFPNPEDPYDAVWHHKLAFYEVGNGDYLSIDLAPETYEQIVYLSHDDGEGHGHVLAENFEDLMERWCPLAFVGGEDWQWVPFTNGLTTLLEPESAAAKSWRKILGL